MNDPALVIEVGRLRDNMLLLVDAIKELTTAVKESKPVPMTNAVSKPMGFKA